MRNTEQTINWYRRNESWPEEIGFDPDGMCLKIVRTARGLSAMFPSALSSQEATPREHRIFRPEKVRKGMIGYFDEVNDENPFGHVVTWVGRVKDSDPTKLSSLLCRTNSVVPNRIVVVRGDYFERKWGDSYQFSSDWLNGQKLFRRQKPLGKARGLREAVSLIETSIAHHKKKGNKRLVAALERDLAELKETIQKFSKRS